MFRLGIIGSDNSHAEAFARLANVEGGEKGFHVEDVQVTHIYGTDAARTKEVAEKGRIPNIVAKPEEMIGKVDGVANVSRHGALHWPETRAVIEAGIPAFIDKPLACSAEDGQLLIDAARKAKVGLTSFSTLPYASATRKFLNAFREKSGTPMGGSVSGPADRTSEYCGVFFYGIHSVELMNAAWGFGCERVWASEYEKNIVAACKLKNGAHVSLNLIGATKAEFTMTVFGERGWENHVIDQSDSYYEGMKLFLHCLRTGEWPLTPEQLLEPVRILAAIERSLESGEEEKV